MMVDQTGRMRDTLMSTRSLNWLKFGGLVGLAFGLGLLFAGLLDLPGRSLAQQGAPARPAINAVAPPPIPGAAPLQNLSDAFAAVVDAVRPGVVYIRASRTEKATAGRQDPHPELPPGFEQFFPRFRRRPEFQQGSGSGFVVSKDGYILTNNHVVDEADEVVVRLVDRREFKAKVIGKDANTDVAVLKIEATGLQPLALGNSDAEKIGEWVLAIGNPLGENLTFTVTSGIISAKGRQLDLPQRTNMNISDFIQTDAAINPGNSGGPLVNVRGEVIGINSAIASETGFYQGYGFAIPINLARRVMEMLITDGKVSRAALGVSIREVDPKDAKYAGLDDIRGVVVAELPEGSSAGKAGLEAGDIILSVDGRPVDRVGQLQQEIGFRKPGETVAVEVARKGGVRKTFRVKLQLLEDRQELAAAAAPAPGAADDAPEGGEAAGLARELLGISVEALTPQRARAMQLPPATRGILVTEVVPGGPSFRSLRESSPMAGDIIVGLEGRAIASESDLRRALGAYKAGDIVTLQVQSYAQGQLGPRRIVRIELGTGDI